MATRPVILHLPGELIEALDEVAARCATSTAALAEQAFVQLLLQHRRFESASGDELEALIRT